MADHLYIHMPFCLSKCRYCAFYSVTDRDDELLDRYTDAVVAELGQRVTDTRPWKTVYIGGGTPSLLGPRRVERILCAVAAQGSLAEAEVTLEANPETVTKSLLVDLRSAGVNRLSLGLQSLVDDQLRYLGRIHNARRGREALSIARQTFDRLSIDLIYGLPEQSVGEWVILLTEAAALGTEHLSAYELTYEPGTPLGDAADETPDRSA